MFVFRHGGRRATQFPPTIHRVRVRHASRIAVPLTPPPFPVLEACPAPTCQCREFPDFPDGLEIDREANINGIMPAYAEQVLISTGRSDWKSKIEEEEAVTEEGMLVKQLKGLLGRGGKYSDPFHNIMLTHSSFEATASPQDHVDATGAPTSASAFLLPSFQYLPTIPTDPASVEKLVQAFVLPSQLHQTHDSLTREQQNILKRQPERQGEFIGARKVDEILVLICGHGGRDARCGILGPILQAEFEEKLLRQNVALLRDPPVAEAEEVDTEVKGYTPTARVGLISHIGGHKFAGNVIIYIPPSFKGNELAGKGVWYSRVGPGDVEGIVAKTILEGKVIKELFRGGIDQDRQILRL